MRLGKLLYKHQRKTDRAIECFEKILEDPEIGFKANFELGCILYDEERDKKKGINLIRESIIKSPNFTAAWNKLGKIMDDNENYEMSKKFYDKSLAIDANNFHARLGIANYFFKKPDHHECENELNKIILPQFANDVRCLKLRADNYFQMEKYDEALECYMKCEKVESPFKLEIRIGIGNCFYKKDDFRNATSTFVLLHQENPQNIPVMINLAACYIMRLKYRDAIKIFEKCRALEPDNWEICLYLAKVYMQLEDFAKATEMITSYIQNSPDGVTGRLKLAEMYEQVGALQSALEELEVSPD